MSIAITDEQRAIQGSLREAAARAGTRDLVRAMESRPDEWTTQWPALAALGLFAVTLPERLGGIGGSLVDQAAAVEQAAEDLIPGPVLPTVLATLLLTDESHLKALAAGHLTAAVALPPAGPTPATPTPGKPHTEPPRVPHTNPASPTFAPGESPSGAGRADHSGASGESASGAGRVPHADPASPTLALGEFPSGAGRVPHTDPASPSSVLGESASGMGRVDHSGVAGGSASGVGRVPHADSASAAFALGESSSGVGRGEPSGVAGGSASGVGRVPHVDPASSAFAPGESSSGVGRVDRSGVAGGSASGVGRVPYADSASAAFVLGESSSGVGRVEPSGVAGGSASGVGRVPYADSASSAFAPGESSSGGRDRSGALAEVGAGLLSGVVEPVLGAHPGALLILPAGNGWFVVEPDSPGLEVTPLPPTDFSRPLARVTLDRVTAQPLPGVTTETVANVVGVLAAAEAAGVARWCLDTAVAYAKVRRQFDRPIGSFQAVKHLCAEMLCRAEQAAALAWDAARAGAAPLPVAAACAIALDAAVENAKDCIQVLGGIGFTWEHDAHLYLRRALATRTLAGRHWRRRTAELALAGERRGLTLTDHDDTTARAAAREFATALASRPATEHRARLAESGYLMPHWPKPYGLAAGPRAQLAIDEELVAAGIRRPDLVIGAWAVPTLLRHGSAAQQDRFVGPTLRGELAWCQLFSEPDAGSDLAALRTRASRVDGGWRLDGQKVWTSAAVTADWGICLARTDPDVPKHAGITYFLVDMRSPGITLRPLREITGDARFNEVFLDGVVVPDDCVVGEVNGGWRLARTTLANERVAIGMGSSLGEAVERLLTAAGPDTDLDRLGFLVAQGLSVSLVDLRATLRQLDGRGPGAESSVCKLVGVRQRQDVAEAALDLVGAAADSAQLHEFLLTRCLSIAGGTTQVLRNLVGERILGLPRER